MKPEANASAEEVMGQREEARLTSESTEDAKIAMLMSTAVMNEYYYSVREKNSLDARNLPRSISKRVVIVISPLMMEVDL